MEESYFPTRYSSTPPFSDVERTHARFVVPFPGGNSLRRGLVYAGEVVAREFDLHGLRVFFEALAALRAGDGGDVIALVEEPREGELPRSRAFPVGYFFHTLDEVEVLLEVLAREARRRAAEIVLGEVVGGRYLPGEEASPERAIWDEADAELAGGREYFVLDVPAL